MVNNLYKSYKGIAMYPSKIPTTYTTFRRYVFWGGSKTFSHHYQSIGWLSRGRESTMRAWSNQYTCSCHGTAVRAPLASQQDVAWGVPDSIWCCFLNWFLNWPKAAKGREIRLEYHQEGSHRPWFWGSIRTCGRRPWSKIAAMTAKCYWKKEHSTKDGQRPYERPGVESGDPE